MNVKHLVRWILPLLVCVLMGVALAPVASQDTTQFRRLPVEVYRQKMTAGWLGQMVGVSLGAPTEFRYRGRTIPESAVPRLHPGIANDAFGQDDLYVEMTFLDTLDTYGLDVSAAQAGIDFANSEYQLCPGANCSAGFGASPVQWFFRRHRLPDRVGLCRIDFAGDARQRYRPG